MEGACTSLMHDTSACVESSSGLRAYSSPARVRVLRSCGWEARRAAVGAVSYTHLTLPTICSV
eukprot:3736707-Prymnesium_polylepis.2